MPAGSAPTVARPVVDYRAAPPVDVEQPARRRAALLAAMTQLGDSCTVLVVAGVLAAAYLLAVAFVTGR